MKTAIYILILTLMPAFIICAQGISIGSGTTFSLGNSTLYLPGNWSNAGTFNAGTGTVVFNGPTGNQTIANTSGEVFRNLTVSKAGGDVVLNNGIVVNGNIIITNGDIDLNGSIMTLGVAAILSETAGNTVKGTSGLIRTVRDLGMNPGNIAGLGVDISSSPALGITTVERSHRPDTVGSSSSIMRNYKIMPANNYGLNATASFYYDNSELNNLTEANLGLYKSTDDGISWYTVAGMLNTTNNYITVSGLESFSKWSLFSTTNPPTDVEEETMAGAEIPKVYALSQNYPNPFNPSTLISFDLPGRSNVILRIYDAIGREVTTLVSEELPAGRYTKSWNASSSPSGVYFCRINMIRSDSKENTTFVASKKLLLIK